MALSPNIITLTDSGLVNFVQQIGSDLNILFSVKTTDYIGIKPGYLVFRNNWGDVFEVSINDVVEVSYGTTTTVYTQIGSAVNFAAGRGVSDKLRDIHTELTNNVFRTCCPMPTFVGDGVVFFANFAALPSPGQSGILYVTEDTSNAYWWDGSAYVAVTNMQRYANFAAFPGTGLAGIFYVDESVPELYYWDGAAYQSLGGTGSGGNANITTITRAALQALIAGTSVSATTIYRITNAVGATKVIDVWGLSTSTISGDAINHTDSEFGVYDITGDTFVAQGDGVYIPLAGTLPGSPVTGDIEIDPQQRFYSNDGTYETEYYIDPAASSRIRTTEIATGDYSEVTIEKHQYVRITSFDNTTGYSYLIEVNHQDQAVKVFSDDPAFAGVQESASYADNYTATSLTNKGYVDAEVVSTNITAKLNRSYTVIANATFTDPTPASGEGFVVFVRNGTATVGGTGYSTAGTLIYRIYHSGAWANYTIGGGGSGTVTSVALSAPSEFTVSGSPVTGSGTLTFTKANQSANLVYAGPSSGGAAAPTFRALVADDIPSSIPRQDSMILANGQGAQTVAAASTTYAALFGGANTLNATESARQSIIANSGTISRFYLRTFTAQPGTGSLVLTIRNNAADTSVVITVAAGAAAGSFSDTSNTAAVVAGDLISVKCVNNAPGTASAQILTISALFTR